MAIERSIGAAEFQARALAYELAQQRMEDEGCPNVLPAEQTRAIAESLALVADGPSLGFRPELGSGRFGREILRGPISTANGLDAQRAQGTAPRQPDVRRNGKA